MLKTPERAKIQKLISAHGEDILTSPRMQLEKELTQHGTVSCFEHSVSVAYMSLRLARLAKVRVDERSLVRGALLHDYFLYDWHDREPGHRLHGFHHARRALANAKADFGVNEREADIILKHMFPLNIALPKYRESVVVTIADKWCACWELLTFFSFMPRPGLRVKALL